MYAPKLLKFAANAALPPRTAEIPSLAPAGATAMLVPGRRPAGRAGTDAVRCTIGLPAKNLSESQPTAWSSTPPTWARTNALCVRSAIASSLSSILFTTGPNRKLDDRNRPWSVVARAWLTWTRDNRAWLA